MIEVELNEDGTRVLAGNEVVINFGSYAAMPDVPGLRDASWFRIIMRLGAP